MRSPTGLPQMRLLARACLTGRSGDSYRVCQPEAGDDPRINTWLTSHLSPGRTACSAPPRQHLGDMCDSDVDGFVLPEPDHRPSGLVKRRVRGTVPVDVA